MFAHQYITKSSLSYILIPDIMGFGIETLDGGRASLSHRFHVSHVTPTVIHVGEVHCFIIHLLTTILGQYWSTLRLAIEILKPVIWSRLAWRPQKPASPIWLLVTTHLWYFKFFTGTLSLLIGHVLIVIKESCIVGEIIYAKFDPSGKKDRPHANRASLVFIWVTITKYTFEYLLE